MPNLADYVTELADLVSSEFTALTGDSLSSDAQYVSDVIGGSSKFVREIAPIVSELHERIVDEATQSINEESSFWVEIFGGSDKLVKSRRTCFLASMWGVISNSSTSLAEFYCASETYLGFILIPGSFSYGIYNVEIFGSLLRRLGEVASHGNSNKNSNSKEDDDIAAGKRTLQQLCNVLAIASNPVERDFTGEQKEMQSLFFRVCTNQLLTTTLSDEVVTNYVLRNKQEREYVQVLLSELVNQNIDADPVLKNVKAILLAGSSQEQVSVLGLTFLQHMMIQASQRKQPDAAGVALSPLVQVVSGVLGNCLPDAARLGTSIRYVSFLERATKSCKVPQRICAIQFAIGLLLSLPMCMQNNLKEWMEYEKDLFKSVLGRVKDKVPAVRVTVLSGLVRYINFLSSSMRDVDKIVSHGSESAESEVDKQLGQDELLKMKHRLHAVRISLCRALCQDDKPNVRRTALQAIVELVSLYSQDSTEFKSLINSIASRAQDKSVAVRKSVLASLNGLIQKFPDSKYLPSVWMTTLLTLVPDRERSIEIKCMDTLKCQVLAKLIEHQHDDGDDANTQVAVVWRALGSASHQDLFRFRDALLKLCVAGELPSASILVPAAQSGIREALNNSDEQQFLTLEQRGKAIACWILLDFCCGGSSLSEQDRTVTTDDSKSPVAAPLPLPKKSLVNLRLEAAPLVDIELVLQTWELREDLTSKASDPDLPRDKQLLLGSLADWIHSKVINVLIGVAPRIPARKASELAQDVLEIVSVLEAEPHVAAQYIKLLVAMCHAKTCNVVAAQKMMTAWVNTTLDKCHTVLKDYTLSGLGINENKKIPSSATEDQQLLVGRALHLVGEIAMINFDPDQLDAASNTSNNTTRVQDGGGANSIPTVPEKIVCLVQALTLPTFKSAVTATISTEVAPNVITPDGNEKISPKKDNNNDQSTLLESSESRAIPISIRAHAFVTIGKFCICNIHVAKSFIPVLIRELSRCTKESEQILQSNILVVLGDMCKRYTSMIDCHLDVISSCLQTASPMVRRTCIILIVGLLQEDYIKWKELLFFRFLLCIANNNEDEQQQEADQQIEQIARYSLVNVFLAKNPVLFHVNFVETLFVFSDVRCHPKHNIMGAASVAQSARLYGPAQRLAIYEFMLQNMNSQQRLEATNKLSKDVIGGLLDGILPTKPANSVEEAALSQLLSDTVSVLSSTHIRVRARGGPGTSEEVDETTGEASVRRQSVGSSLSSATNGTALETAKGRVLTKLALKNVTENLVPVAVSTYRLLQRHRSPFSGQLSNWLIYLLKTFPDQVLPVLDQTENRELLAELRYDIKQAERAAKRQSFSSIGSLRSPISDKDMGGVATPTIKRSRSLPTPGTAAARTPPGSRIMSPLVARAFSAKRLKLDGKTPVPKLSTIKKPKQRTTRSTNENQQQQPRVVKLSFES